MDGGPKFSLTEKVREIAERMNTRHKLLTHYLTDIWR
jgi:Mn-dependent DtxR family transcriptional regulator